MNNSNSTTSSANQQQNNSMSNPAVDEMFPERFDGHAMRMTGQSSYFPDLDEAGGSMMDMGSSDKFVHADFYNAFDDLFDEEDLD